MLKKRQYLGVYFEVNKFSGLDGKTHVEYVQDAPNPFKVRASPMGIMLDGKIEITSNEHLSDFAQLISDAWTQHEKLAPKIVMGTGH